MRRIAYSLIFFSFFIPLLVFASSNGDTSITQINLTNMWIGYVCLIIFVSGYILISASGSLNLNKSKPALLTGTLMFILIGIYFAFNGLDVSYLNKYLEVLIFEIVQIFFFLFVAMVYVEVFIDRNIFEVLKYKLVSKNYTYKKIFWLIGLLAFFTAPFIDSLTSALITATMLFSIEKKDKNFLVQTAVNIVVASNAGGVWSPFGNITTLMVWTAKKASLVDFLLLLPVSFLGWFVTAYIISRKISNKKLELDSKKYKEPVLKVGAKMSLILFFITISSAVIMHYLVGFPAMWGMMFGLSLLFIYSYRLQITEIGDFEIFSTISKIENDTLLFFFGILSAVGALSVLGFLEYVSNFYNFFGPIVGSVAVGLISAVLDNVPIMSAMLKSQISVNKEYWTLITLTVGIGGSLIIFGSAAGVATMGKFKKIYTFYTHLKYSGYILLGYIVSILAWYIQFILLGWG